ncbi:hypothetical protein [Pseudoalteromonas citrea]|uniref:hypothetical protein n=1 Tax=Pseudoalteromonas citrea TaxID=43655 RepID=UPI0012F93DF4|nr:hypothetical protein [Pseudoalteromonas citrea]
MKWFTILVSVLMCISANAADKWRGLLEIQPNIFLTIGVNVDIADIRQPQSRFIW